MTGPGPLAGVKVLDLSTLLPGPLTTLMLADAGADVIKVERPGGDEMRTYTPRFGPASANYAILNRGKRAYAADLKDPTERDQVLQLATRADIVVEQFRPGVVDRLGLGYQQVSDKNPRVVYCSITGYGPTGPHAQRAGHDLTYLAESGLLGVVTDPTGAPNLPISVLADIAGGTYPAVLNILLALRQREQTGRGTHLQVSMTRNLQVLGYGYFATHQAGGAWPRPSGELLTGGSPRYHIYPTADGRHIACAALEQRFWDRLVELIDLPKEYRDDSGREPAVIDAMTARFSSHTAEHWDRILHEHDVCTAVVSTWAEAVDAGLVDVNDPDTVTTPGAGTSFPTLPSPISRALRRPPAPRSYPDLAPLAGSPDPWGPTHDSPKET